MRMKIGVFALVATLCAMVAVLGAASPAGARSATSGIVKQVPLAGVGSPQTGDSTPSGESDVTQAEFPGQEDEADGPGPYPGTIVNRSLSQGVGSGASVKSGKKAKSGPQFNTGFEGLNLYQQR